MIYMKNLSFSYGKNELFSDLNLTVESGNIYGLLGRNGAGKSTLLKLTAGMLIHDRGECSIMELDPGKRFPEMLQEIYYLPEEFYLPAITGDQYEKIYAPFYPKFNTLDFQKYLLEFELSSSNKLTSLSYGQKKKFLLAFGIASGVSLLLLDEPTNGLDIPSKSQFRRMIAAAMNDDRTFIISTHQVKDVENLIDPVIILEEGEIIFNKTMESVGEVLTVELLRNEPAGDEAIYSEKVLGGYTALKKNETGQSGAVDLETLFNAIISRKETVLQMFTREDNNDID